MLSHKHDSIIVIDGVPHKQEVLLADANVPYKICLDRINNRMFFCINAEEASDQSFQSVVLDLNTKVSSIIPGIRNGFAAAVDQTTGTAYLGGSQGIFKYDPSTRDVGAALLTGIDIIDMFYKDDLYFVDTGQQCLHIYKNDEIEVVSPVKDQIIYHFVIDNQGDLFFISSTRLFLLRKGEQTPVLIDDRSINYRGATADVHGVPHMVAQDGVYRIDKKSNQLTKILSLDNGYGLAFDKSNNIIYSNERSIIKLVKKSSECE